MKEENQGIQKDHAVRDRLLFIAMFCYHGVNTRRAELTRKWVLAFLPGLFRLEDGVPSEWQSLSQETSKALAALKHHLLLNSGEDIDRVLTIVQHILNQHGAPRRQRLAALSYLQHFWFRHITLLSSLSIDGGVNEQPSPRIQLVVDMVFDQLIHSPDTEVRRAAAVSIAGLARLGGRDDHDLNVGSKLRQRILCTAEQVFFGSRQKSSSVSQETLAKKHGAVLGLSALVQSSPYDIPAWLPRILSLLVKLSGIPNPALIRTTVTEALGEFRRTHPIESIDRQVAEVLTSEEWDAIRDVASPASYFV